MSTKCRLTLTTTALVCILALAGCGTGPQQPAEQSPPASTPPPAESAKLFDELTAAGYTEWEPAPGYATPQAAKGPHGDEVKILLDPAAQQGVSNGSGQWPVGAVIAKDIYQGGSLVQIAAMKKTAEGWYWGEWDAEGAPIAEGLAIEPCEGCHAAGTDGTLGVALK